MLPILAERKLTERLQFHLLDCLTQVKYFDFVLVIGDANDVAITDSSLFMILAWSSTDGANNNYPKHICNSLA